MTALETRRVKERVFAAPGSSPLWGVMADPASGASGDARPAVILLNAGLVHRIGPSRLYVRLARSLAAAGFPVLRFDLSGRGDSDSRAEDLSFPQRSLAEVREAMDQLELQGIARHFVLMGICSGAADAGHAAGVDPRVVGAVMIDGGKYPTLQSHIRYYARRLMSARSWWNTLTARNRLGRSMRRMLTGHSTRSGPNSGSLVGEIAEAGIPRDTAASAMHSLIARGVQLCVVYSGGPRYNYKRQFQDAFSDVDFQDRVVVEYFADADHTFTKLESQKQLERAIVGWTVERFSQPAEVAEPVDAPAADTEAVDVDAPDLVPDTSGRRALVRNVLWSWAGHIVFLVAGFLMPRLIDNRLGQASLGIWDFCWSLVSYFSFAQIGIGSSVNRQVARHRATKDVVGLRRTVSSVMAVQLVVAAVVLALTAAAVLAMPSLFGSRLGDSYGQAVWVVTLLGTSLAVQMAFHVFNGVVTGCHRWDIQNVLESTSHAAIIVGMVIALVVGGNLTALAAAVLIGTTVVEVVRVFVARRVCPELSIAWRDVRVSEALRMIMFGGKLSIIGLAGLVLIQTNSLLVAGQLGVAALATYARPLSLIRQTIGFARKFSMVLVPTAGSLQSAGKFAELQSLTIVSTRYMAALVFPVLISFATLGGPLLRVWMGAGYEQPEVLAILALSHLALSFQPASMILIGMNRHSGLMIAAVVGAAGGLLFAALSSLWLEWTLISAATSVAIGAVIGGACVPYFITRELNLSVTSYLRQSFLVPVLSAVPYTALMLFCRYEFSGRPLAALAAGIVGGALVLGPIYWRFVLSTSLRLRLVSRLERFGAAIPLRRSSNAAP